MQPEPIINSMEIPDRLMNILAIGAHPDDIEFGCAGTLIKFRRKGHRLNLLIMTGGEMGGTSDIRKAEQADAAAVMGVDSVFWGGYTDTTLSVDRELIGQIEKVIDQLRPDFILCHFPDDTHQDHRHLAQAAISATRYIRNVLFYEGPTTQNFTANVFVDIASTMDRKTDALTAHHSQVMKTNIEDRAIIDLAQATATYRGIQGRVKYAEAFHPLRLFINV